MDLKKIDVTKVARYLVVILGVLVLTLAIFAAGVSVGFRKARFSYQWGDNYHRMFGGPRQGWMMPPPPPGLREGRNDDFMNPAGAAGVVINVSTSTVYINGSDNLEKSVIISGATVIRKGRIDLKIDELKPDDRVVVFGSPSSSGQIEAKLIRVFDR